MGFRGISLGSLLLVLLIVLLIFGSKRLRHLGEDFGKALKDFRKGVRDADDDSIQEKNTENTENNANNK